MAGTALSQEAVALYTALIGARLQATLCAACGASLGGSRVERSDGGLTLEDYGLSDTGTVHLLAATEHLVVRCAHCQAQVDVGTPVHETAPVPPALPAPPYSLPAEAASLYLQLVRERLQDAGCPTCGVSLARGQVLRATDAAVADDHDLSDLAFARLLAATQSLLVRCAGCAQDAELGPQL